MWIKKVKAVPVIIGATVVAERNLKKHHNRAPEQHNIHYL